MTTNSWVQDVSGNWFLAENWSEGYTPKSGEDAVIDTSDPQAITFNGSSASVNSLTVGDDSFDVASGWLTIAGAASFGGALDVSGGTLAFADASTDLTQFNQTGGAVRVATGLLSLYGRNMNLGGVIEGTGELYIEGTANLVAGGAISTQRIEVTGLNTALTISAQGVSTFGGGFYLDDGATATLGGGTLTLKGYAETNEGIVAGAGTFVTSGSASIDGLTVGGSVHWIDEGSAIERGDDLILGDNSGGVVKLTISAKGVYAIDDDVGIELGSAGSMIQNDGAFGKTGGDDTSVIAVDFRDTGTVENSISGSDLVFDGAHNYLSGVYTGPGMIDYGADGVAALGDLEITQSACGTNLGIVNVTGVVTLHDGSTLVNDFYGKWNFDGDVGLALAAGSSDPMFTNYGVLAKTAGSGVSVVAIDVIQSQFNDVDAEVGTLAFDGPTNTILGKIIGKGAFELGGGDTTIESGAKFRVATFSVSGATTQATFETDIAYDGTFALEGGATLDMSGDDFTLSGAATFGDGIVDGASTLLTKGVTAVSGLTIGGTAEWQNSGTVTQRGGGLLLANAGGAILENTASGVYDIVDNSGISGGQAVGSRITNAGRIEKTAGRKTTIIAPDIVNTGSLLVAKGTLDITGALTGAGTVEVVKGAVMELSGAVAVAQTASFSDPGSEIWLNDLRDSGTQVFNGKLRGFGAGDMIDIGSATFAGFRENATDTSGVLTLHDGTASASITLLGDYVPGNFASTVVGGQNVLNFQTVP